MEEVGGSMEFDTLARTQQLDTFCGGACMSQVQFAGTGSVNESVRLFQDTPTDLVNVQSADGVVDPPGGTHEQFEKPAPVLLVNAIVVVPLPSPT